jgi:copper transport protein
MALVGMLVIPSAVFAHARLLRSNPAQGAMLESRPSEIRLFFSEKPELSLSSIRIVWPAGDTTLLFPLRRDSSERNSIVASLGGTASRGTYKVLWSAAASDGHPSHGTVEFSVVDAQAPVASADSKVTAEPAPAAPLENSTMLVATGGALVSLIARWLGFVSIFLIIGAVTFRYFVLRRMSPGQGDLFVEIATTNAATLGLIASVASIFASMLKLARESADMPDAPLGSMLFGSLWGLALLIQIIAALVAGGAFATAHKNREATQTGAWRFALLAAAMFAIAPALGGHALAASQSFIAVPADIVHVAVGSMWLGTLAVIVVVGIPATLKAPDSTRPGARVAAMVNTFSPLALTCGGAVVATGVASSLLRLPSLAALWTSFYGVALLLKLFFVVLLFAAGAWNWKRMKPRLTGENAISPLRSSAWLELVIASVVLAITAILVAVELP